MSNKSALVKHKSTATKSIFLKGEGRFSNAYFSDTSGATYTKFGEGICQSSALPRHILHFIYVATIQKQYTSKAKIKAKFQTFSPAEKIRVVMGKMSEWIKHKCNQKPNSWYTFAGCSCVSDGIKKHISKTQHPSTIVGRRKKHTSTEYTHETYLNTHN